MSASVFCSVIMWPVWVQAHLGAATTCDEFQKCLPRRYRQRRQRLKKPGVSYRCRASAGAGWRSSILRIASWLPVSFVWLSCDVRIVYGVFGEEWAMVLLAGCFTYVSGSNMVSALGVQPLERRVVSRSGRSTPHHNTIVTVTPEIMFSSAQNSLLVLLVSWLTLPSYSRQTPILAITYPCHHLTDTPPHAFCWASFDCMRRKTSVYLL